MTVVMATVGFRADKILPVLEREDRKEELVLFYDKDPEGRSKNAAKEVAEQGRKLEVKVTLVEMNAFDLVASCRQIRTEIQKRPGKDIVLSIAGGTRVISSAALLAAILEGVRVVHISEKDNAVQPLPMLRLEAGAVLNNEKRKVLAYIRAHAGCAQRDIAQHLGLSKGTVSHHVQGLLKQGLLESTPDPEDSRSHRLRAVPSADILLME